MSPESQTEKSGVGVWGSDGEGSWGWGGEEGWLVAASAGTWTPLWLSVFPGSSSELIFCKFIFLLPKPDCLVSLCLKCWGGCVHIHLQIINDVHGSLEDGPSILGQISRLPLPPRNAPKSPTTAGEGDCSQFPPKNSETGPPLRKIKTACCAVCRTPGCQGAAVSYF